MAITLDPSNCLCPMAKAQEHRNGWLLDSLSTAWKLALPTDDFFLITKSITNKISKTRGIEFAFGDFTLEGCTVLLACPQ